MHKLSLTDPDVELWYTDLHLDTEAESNAKAYLSLDEMARANRFKFQKDRSQFIAARSFLRQLLGKYVNAHPSHLTFAYSDYGKPYLPDYPDLAFNLSHSGGYAVCGLSSKEMIGVDLEHTDRSINVELVVSHFFAKGEIDRLFSLPREEWTRAFFRCWTRKEAFIKAKGDGLSLGLDQFEVSLDSEESARLLETHYLPEDVYNWRMKSFDLTKDYVGAVVIRA